MDNSLFKKHLKVFNERNDNKNKLIIFIKNRTKILLKENEIKIEKNIVSFNISSVKKSLLYKNNIKEILKEEGFILK